MLLSRHSSCRYVVWIYSRVQLDTGKSNVKTAAPPKCIRSWKSSGGRRGILRNSGLPKHTFVSMVFYSAESRPGRLQGSWCSRSSAFQTFLSQFLDEPPNAFCSFGCLPPGPPTDRQALCTFSFVSQGFLYQLQPDPTPLLTAHNPLCLGLAFLFSMK